ncbi:NlpC/P60 family protein [Propionibacteriaceae bacterium Y2011]
MIARNREPRLAGLGKAARGVVVGAAALAVVFAAGAPAQADPDEQPTTVAEARKQVDKLEQESAVIDQKYVDAQERLKEAERQLATKKRDLVAQQAKVAKLRESVARIALQQYQNRGIDQTTKLVVSSSPEGLLRDLSVMERVSANQRVTLQNYQTETANLGDLQRASETDVEAMTTAKAEMTEARTESEAKIAEAKKILAKLTEEERRRIEEQRRAEAAAAARAAEQAREEAAARATRSGERSSQSTESNRSTESNQQQKKTQAPKTETPAPPASGRGQQALAFAASKLGTPYLYGGTGPRYDCSGLTQAAWRSAGVSIGRTTGAQRANARYISRSQLQPGDLVFFYGTGHVALYVGGNTIIHSPRTGTVVRYEPMSNMPVSSYGRVG